MIKPCRIIVGFAALAFAITASAQVIIRGTESPDNTASHSEVTITTPDRTMVPMINDTKDTKVNATTQRTDSIVRERLNDGTYFDAQHTTSVKKDISPNQSVSSTDVVEKDRQGQAKLSKHTDETVVKSAGGETDQTKAYTRDSSGNLVLDRVVDANVVKGSDGSTTTSYVKVPDVNGNLVLQTQQNAVTVDRGPNEKVTTTKTMDVDHLSGKLSATAQETTSITTQGGVKQTQSTVLTPGRTGWELSTRTSTKETTAADGSVTRETVEEARSIYSTKTGDQMMEPLVPQRKVVEHEVHQANGSTVVERDVFHRDVNGDWKAESFSTKEPNNGKI